MDCHSSFTLHNVVEPFASDTYAALMGKLIVFVNHRHSHNAATTIEFLFQLFAHKKVRRKGKPIFGVASCTRSSHMGRFQIIFVMKQQTARNAYRSETKTIPHHTRLWGWAHGTPNAPQVWNRFSWIRFSSYLRAINEILTTRSMPIFRMWIYGSPGCCYFQKVSAAWKRNKWKETR